MLQFANHYVEVYWHMIEGTKIKWRNMGKRLVAHCVTNKGIGNGKDYGIHPHFVIPYTDLCS